MNTKDLLTIEQLKKKKIDLEQKMQSDIFNFDQLCRQNGLSVAEVDHIIMGEGGGYHKFKIKLQ